MDNDLKTGYKLSRAWFDFCFENPEKIKPGHTAIYFFAIEHCNRLGWKAKFGFPSAMAMDAIGIKKWHTFIKYFNDLIDWGFFSLIEKSKNQYSSNIISIVLNADKKHKSLDKAFICHAKKRQSMVQSTGQSTGQSNGSINKQVTINQLTKEKTDFKKENKFLILPDIEKTNIVENILLAYPKQAKLEKGRRAIVKVLIDGLIDHEDLYKIVKKYAIAISWQKQGFIPDPETWFNDQRWNDDPETWNDPKKTKQGVYVGKPEEYPESDQF